ncbi:MAG TPA: hypothetical protein VFC18_22700, partial [Burkholderiales bacterium]|nr:hypothetical protein [Burkholderiales bacterium]
MPLSRLLLLLAVAACAAPPEPGAPSPAARAELGPLPASFINTPSCSGCLAVTVTLRADGAYTVRERLGTSEFYDFGAWRETDGILHLAGGRDALRRYRLAQGGLLEAREGTPGGDLRRAAEPESLRGPFRMLGRYDGEVFQE